MNSQAQDLVYIASTGRKTWDAHREIKAGLWVRDIIVDRLTRFINKDAAVSRGKRLT